MTDALANLLARLENGERGNAIDVDIEIALFEPDTLWKKCRANSAKTKVIYTRFGKKESTHWAYHWSDEPADTIAKIKERISHD